MSKNSIAKLSQASVFLFTGVLVLAGCTSLSSEDAETELIDVQSAPVEEAPYAGEQEASREVESGDETNEEHVAITIEGVALDLVLADNETARAFAALMPLEVDMRDVNGNEKFAELEVVLPVDEHAPGHVEVGDVMLYGNNGVVLFYESFDTSYSYTRLGCVSDPAAIEGLTTANNIQVVFGS